MATYTLYDPMVHAANLAPGLLLAPNSKISVILDSVILKAGFGTAVDAEGVRDTASMSYYDGSIAELGIGAGLLFTSGDAAPPDQNLSDDYSVQLSPSNVDADLKAAVKAGFPLAGDVQDATVLQFDFTVTDPNLKGIQFDLIFASEEFPEWSDTDYVDIGAVFINGVNYALFNGRVDQPLSIIDRNLAAGGFRNNAASSIPIEYDGVSIKLTIVAPLQAGVNTIKIAVGDTGDPIYDSGMFVSNMRAVPFTGTGLGTLVQGTALDDNLVGGDFREVFDLDRGNDFATGNGGDDLLLGGLGIDTAVYTTSLSHLTVAKTPSGYVVTDTGGGQGIDSLVDMERIKASDKHLALDLGTGQAAGNAVKLIGAIFGEQYLIPEFVGIGINLFDSDWSMTAVAQLALNTDLYLQLAGSRSNADLVRLLYENVVGVEPSAVEQAYFQGLLDRGDMTQAQLAVLAAETDINAVNVNLVGLADHGIEFTPVLGG